MSREQQSDSTTGRKKPWYRRIIASLLLIILVAAAALILLVKSYRDYIGSPEPAIKRSKLVVIKPGMTFNRIAEVLFEEGIVSRPRAFTVLARLKGATTRVQAGEYTFKPGFTPLQILDIISRGDVTIWKLVVPEGFTVFEIARRLSELGPWSEEQLIDAAKNKTKTERLDIPLESLEGYLFPAVYELRLSMTEEQVVDLMVRRGLREKTEERMARTGKLGFDWHQVLTMASLLEKETADREEMRLIAGVFMKRLEKKMPLQSDPTAVYGINDFNGPITRRDLKRKSPYNTYIHRGLPPGPICNPGAHAIDAALDPQDTDYLYFVATGDGGHVFAKTFIQHMKNIRKHRKNKGGEE